MANKRIAFIYDTLHPLHKKFFKSVNCDLFPFSNSLPKNYDVYIFEGTYIKPLFLKRIGKIDKNSKIVTLFSDPRLFYLDIGKRFDFKRKKMIKYSKWRSFWAKRFIKELDGAVCIGDFSESLFKKFNKKAPVLNIPGFVFKENFNKLTKIKPKLSSKNILFIGYGPDYYVKGIDLLLEVFKKIKKEVPYIHLYILGGDWDIKKEWLIEGVHFKGIQDVSVYLKNAALTVHFGRGESFGINILESMLAGVPIIISEYTGAKQAVIRVNKNLVLPLDKEVITKKMVNYFNLPIKEKMELSGRCKKIAKEFNEEKTLKVFKRKFYKLIKDLYKIR